MSWLLVVLITLLCLLYQWNVDLCRYNYSNNGYNKSQLKVIENPLLHSYYLTEQIGEVANFPRAIGSGALITFVLILIVTAMKATEPSLFLYFILLVISVILVYIPLNWVQCHHIRAVATYANVTNEILLSEQGIKV